MPEKTPFLVNPEVRFLIESGYSADEEPAPDAGEEDDAEEAMNK